ncbi:Immunoglobulin-like fold [Phytophthora cactorum]|nr:Immunoglobulin-like fold [Phytophthora cactorum]
MDKTMAALEAENECDSDAVEEAPAAADPAAVSGARWGSRCRYGRHSMYLAPLMSTSKEIFFAKHKELLKEDSNAVPSSEEQQEDGSKKLMLASLERHLAKIQKPVQQLGSLNQQLSSSAFDVPSPGGINRSNAPIVTTTETAAATSADDQLKKMKQRVKLLPISDGDHTAFWETIRGYGRMRAYYHQNVLAGGASSPMGFNMEAAFKRMLLQERHQQWVSTHESRVENNKVRKAQEDENYERRVIEASSGFRAQLRLQKRIRVQLLCEAQNMQPIVMLGAFTQKMLNMLRLYWSQRRLESHLSRTIRIWRQHRVVKHNNSNAARLLIEWLQNSVAVKSVGFRVFRGLRVFIRRLKLVQGLWHKKQATRKLKFLIIEKAWIELETQYVDAAIEEHEGKRFEIRSPKADPNQKIGSRKKREVWMRFVPESFRTPVILEFLQKIEKEYREKFRSQEIDFFPQLVQTLRGEHPNRARTYIRAVATQHALCGKVVESLLQYPGAVGNDVAVVEPFDVHLAPVSELIKVGRVRYSNRPHSRSPNDDQVRKVFEAKYAEESEGYRKQLALLLQRRQQLRQISPITEELAQQPATAQHPEYVQSGAQQTPVIPKQSFGLVAVSYNFRNLPVLSERTKDVAMTLFDSLVGHHFNHFSQRGSKLLLNPSVIEFQDTMKELKKICAEEPDSSFFMCLSTHGARVTRGANEGSYVLFSETRLSSEEELVLTAIHERELAEMINDIPCKNKFVALELCQLQEPKDKIIDDAETIRHRIHEQFLSQLYKRIVQLRCQSLLERGVRPPSNEEINEEAVRTNPKLLNLVMMESCNVKTEVPVRANEERVSNFLLRFRDAFRGAAITPELEKENGFEQGSRPSLFAREVLKYVCKSIREDAAKHNALVHAEYRSQVRTRYEHAAEFQDITHTPSVLGAEHAIDFGLGEIPEPPTVSLTPPLFVSSTLNSISLTWTAPVSNVEAPTVLGFHIERRGVGRACTDEAGGASVWKRAAAFQVLSYEEVVRNGVIPPTAVTVYGLATDTTYCFRVRARTAGGWGSFSTPTTGYRTLSATSTLDQQETIRLAAIQEGAKGITKLMDKHKNAGAIQRYATEILATMAMKGSIYVSCAGWFSLDSNVMQKSKGSSPVGGRNAGMRSLEPTDLQVVIAVRNAMLKFKKDMHLQQQGCLLFGRLAGSGVDGVAINFKYPTDIATRTERDYNSELTRSAAWALEQVHIKPLSLRQKPRYVLKEHEAAIRLQGLYRCRKAREDVRALARSVYAQAIDPTTRMAYVYNTRTGETFWELPRFAW